MWHQDPMHLLKQMIHPINQKMNQAVKKDAEYCKYATVQ